MLKCRLTLLSTNHEVIPLRTDEVEGYCYAEPTEGKRFAMQGPALDPSKDFRAVTTSKVVGRTVWQDEKEIEFATQNSTYRWERLEEE